MNLWSHFISQATNPDRIPQFGDRFCAICQQPFRPKVANQTLCSSPVCKKKAHAENCLKNYHKRKAAKCVS